MLYNVMSGCGLFFLQGRGDLHFLTEATKLIPESPDRDRYRHKIDNFPRLLLMKEHAVFTQTSQGRPSINHAYSRNHFTLNGYAAGRISKGSSPRCRKRTMPTLRAMDSS